MWKEPGGQGETTRAVQQRAPESWPYFRGGAMVVEMSKMNGSEE
jgi:hypothetical protein